MAKDPLFILTKLLAPYVKEDVVVAELACYLALPQQQHPFLLLVLALACSPRGGCSRLLMLA